MNYQSIKQYCRMTICVCDYLFDKVIDQHRCWSSIQMTKSRSHYSDQPMTRAGPLLNHRGPAAVRDAVVLFSAMIVTVAAIVGVDLWLRPGEKDNDRILEVIIVFLPKTRITPTPQMTVAMKIAVVLLLLFLLLMVMYHEEHDKDRRGENGEYGTTTTTCTSTIARTMSFASFS
jgi:hypothetical protein